MVSTPSMQIEALGDIWLDNKAYMSFSTIILYDWITWITFWFSGIEGEGLFENK